VSEVSIQLLFPCALPIDGWYQSATAAGTTGCVATVAPVCYESVPTVLMHDSACRATPIRVRGSKNRACIFAALWYVVCTATKRIEQRHYDPTSTDRAPLPLVEVRASLGRVRCSDPTANGVSYCRPTNPALMVKIKTLTSNLFVSDKGDYAVCLNKKAATGTFLSALNTNHLKKESFHNYARELLNGSLPLLTTVRHPYYRLVSAFYDKCVMHPRAYFKCQPFLPKRLNATHAAFSFHDFVSNFYAQKIIGNMDWRKVDGHLRSQIHMCALAEVPNVIMIRQEQLLNDIKRVRERYHYHQALSEPLLHKHRRNSVKLADRLIDNSILAKLMSIYKEDFDRLSHFYSVNMTRIKESRRSTKHWVRRIPYSYGKGPIQS